MEHLYLPRLAKLTFAALLLLMIGTNTTFAQGGGGKVTIIGTIADEDGPLPGASVILKGQNIGVLTDIDGRFTLGAKVADSLILEVRYLGYTEYRDTIVGNADANIDLGTVKMSVVTTQLATVNIEGSARTGSELKAFNMMQISGQVISVMSSEQMRKLPDKNAAETVRRMSGAAVQNNKGEGAYISLRGTPTDWTSVLLNGDRLPVSDEDNNTRSFQFEVLPSELIEYVIVNRTSTPDLEGDNIGGTINFITKNVPEKKIFYVGAGAGVSVLAEKPTMNFSLLFGNVTKNKKFAYLGNVSYFGRYYGAQGMKLIFGNNFNHSIDRFELKDYEGLRNTVGANLALEYRPTTKVKIGIKGIFSTMIDDKYQRKTMYVYASGENSGYYLQNVRGQLQRFMGGGQLYADVDITPRIKLNVKVASYINSFGFGNVPYNKPDARNGYMTMEFRQDRTDIIYNDQVQITNNGGAYDPNAPGANDPLSDAYLWGPAKVLDLDNPYGTGDNFRRIIPQRNLAINPDSMSFRRGFSQINRTREQDPIVVQVDLNYKVRNNLTLKFGAKERMKTGSRFLALNVWVPNVQLTQDKIFFYNQFETAPFNTRGGYMRQLSNAYNGNFFPFLTNNALNNIGTFFNQQGDSLRQYNADPNSRQFYSDYLKQFAGSNYSYTEFQTAFYAMADWKPIKNVTILGGIRIEHTLLSQRSDTLTNNLVRNPFGDFYYPTKTQYTNLNYLAILPSVNVTWSAKPNMNLRFAMSRTFHRPNFPETKPGYAEISYADFEYTFGNPNLKPTYSLNLDAIYEYYWGDAGMFSIGTYYKFVTDHIFKSTQGSRNDNNTGSNNINNFDAQSGVVYKSYVNAANSWVFGVELNFTRKFDFIPGPMSGLGISGNVTYSVSRMSVPGRNSSQAMAKQTPILYNVAIFYEKYGVSARLALNYTGAYLEALNLAAVKDRGLLHKDAGFDIFIGENYSLDFQVGYEFKKHYAVFVDAYNLLDWPFIEYRGNPNRPTRYEYYRQRIQFGFKYTL
jgi:TonB-dependent receptor